jgi:hypothetical protein
LVQNPDRFFGEEEAEEFFLSLFLSFLSRDKEMSFPLAYRCWIDDGCLHGCTCAIPLSVLVERIRRLEANLATSRTRGRGSLCHAGTRTGSLPPRHKLLRVRLHV